MQTTAKIDVSSSAATATSAKSQVIKTMASNSQYNNRTRVLQALAGAGAGAITKTAIAPLERVKILFQVQGMKTKTGTSGLYGRSIVGCLRVIVKQDGFIGLYKGNGANVIRTMPVYALKFSFNDSFKNMFRSSTNQRLSFGKLILSGILAGTFQICITYPLELIRTRLTLSSSYGGIYRGIIHCGLTTVRQEGFFALYKGIPPTIMTGGPYVGLQMTFYELFKRRIPEESIAGRRTLLWTLSCGACAGLIAQTITFPGDTIRRRMQSNGIGGTPRTYATTWDCLRKTVKFEGMTGLYRGLSTNVLRCIPGAAIQFTAYDSLKKLMDVDV